MELTQILHMFAGSLKLLELNFCNQAQLEGLENHKIQNQCICGDQPVNPIWNWLT